MRLLQNEVSMQYYSNITITVIFFQYNNSNNNNRRFKTEKEGAKAEKYQDLKRKIMRMWNLKSAQVILIIVGALGGVTRKLGNWVRKLAITL